MSVENILVVRRSLFDEVGAFQGFSSDSEHYLRAFFRPGNSFFLPRPDAEQDPSHKQLIPYCVFAYGGKVLRYTRGGSSGEKRLAAKMSIGIGGHVNDSDVGVDGFDEAAYTTSVHREISEELHINGTYTDRIIGLINDDSNEVGKVHLGVVHLVTLNTDDVTPGEAAIADPVFVSPDDLLKDVGHLETWSQIVAEALDSLELLRK